MAAKGLAPPPAAVPAAPPAAAATDVPPPSTAAELAAAVAAGTPSAGARGARDAGCDVTINNTAPRTRAHFTQRPTQLELEAKWRVQISVKGR